MATLLPISAWILACLVLANAYSGVFYSLLALPKTEEPVDTIDQFLEHITAHDHLELVGSVYISQLFLQASPANELFHRIGQRFNR